MQERARTGGAQQQRGSAEPQAVGISLFSLFMQSVRQTFKYLPWRCETHVMM